MASQTVHQQHALLNTSPDLRRQNGGDKGRRYLVKTAEGDSMCGKCKRTIDQGEVEVITQAAKDEAWYSRHLGCFSDTQVWNTGRLGNLIGYLTLPPAQRELVYDRYCQVAELDGSKLPTPPCRAEQRRQGGKQRQWTQQASQQRQGWRHRQQQVGGLQLRQRQQQQQQQQQQPHQEGQDRPPVRNGQADTQTPVARRLEPFLARTLTAQLEAQQPLPRTPLEIQTQAAMVQRQQQHAPVLLSEPQQQCHVQAEVPEPRQQQRDQEQAAVPLQRRQQQQQQQQPTVNPAAKYQLQPPLQAPAKGVGAEAPRRKQLTLNFCSKPAVATSSAGHHQVPSAEQGWDAAGTGVSPTAGTEVPLQQRKKPRLGNPTTSSGSLAMPVPSPPLPCAAAAGAAGPAAASIRYNPLPLSRVAHEFAAGKASAKEPVCSQQLKQHGNNQSWGRQAGEQQPPQTMHEAREVVHPVLPAREEVHVPQQEQQQHYEAGASPATNSTPASQARVDGKLLQRHDFTPSNPQEPTPAAVAGVSEVVPAHAASQPGEVEAPTGLMAGPGQPAAVAQPPQQQQQPAQQPATAATGDLGQQTQTLDVARSPQEEEQQQHEERPLVLAQTGQGATAGRRSKRRWRQQNRDARVEKLERMVAKLEGQLQELERQQSSSPLIGPGWALGLARPPCEQALRRSLEDAQAAERDLQAQKTALQERARELE